MKQGYTHITLILDKSGSMETIKADAIGGFNSFIEKQKAEPGEATVNLVLFSNGFTTPHDFVPLAKVEPLTDAQYTPGGGTALLDAIGHGIIRTGRQLAALGEAQRPEGVLFVVITDGEENSSREFSREKIAEMVKEQEGKYSWKFAFIGANIDEVLTASSLGVARGATLGFRADAAGTEEMYAELSAATAQYRSAPAELKSRHELFPTKPADNPATPTTAKRVKVGLR